MNCQDNSRLKVPLPEACRTADIGCVPISNGKPKCPPEPDQLPLAYDPNSKTIWIFDCDSRDWNAYTRFSLSELGEVSLDNFRDVCNMLKVPVFYNPGTGTVEGHMTLADFGEKLKECLNLPGTDSKTVVKAGDNVNVTSSTAGSTTTYTVSATGGGDEDSKTVIEAGDNITLTSNKSGATTTYKISADIPEFSDSVTVVEAGDNVNVVPSTVGNKTTYKVSSTGGGPQDSKTIVQAGNNTTVTSTTSGATTTYTVNASVPSTDTVAKVEAGTGIKVVPVTDGNTTTYTVSSTVIDTNDIAVVKGGTGIDVTSSKSGNTTTYTVTNTGGSGGGDGNDITKVVAGDNVTVTSATSGSTTTYTVNSTGGGPQDSKTIVAAGDGIGVTSATSGATTTYTVSATGGSGDSEGSVAKLFTTAGGASNIQVFVDNNTGDPQAVGTPVVFQARDMTFLYQDGTAHPGGTIRSGSASIATFTVTNPFTVSSLLELDISFYFQLSHWVQTTNDAIEGVVVFLNVSETRDKDYVRVYQSGALTSFTDESTAVITFPKHGAVGGSYNSLYALRHSAILGESETKTFYVNYWVLMLKQVIYVDAGWFAATKGTATIFRNHKTV